MAMKNMVEVVIAGRVYKISGYESPEYLHQIAVYQNDKMSELQNMDSYRKQNTDQKQLLLNMNLADDFFKAKRQADKLTGDLEKKERELYGVRHDLIEAQLALENQKKELEDLKAEKKAREKELASLKKQKEELESLLDQKTEPDTAAGGAGGSDTASEAGIPFMVQNQSNQPGQPRQNHSTGRRYSGNNRNTKQN